MQEITKRQKDLLNIIYTFIKSTGYAPTFEHMREEFGVCSNQSIIDHLKKLEQKKFIKRDKGIARSLTILPLGYQALNKPKLTPFLGTTSAGLPIEAIEIKGEWQELSQEVSKLNDVFLLKITGDSMINAGIDNGDIVLVKKQEHFISGDIVLARVEGSEATVKRFISEDKPPYTYLKPENPKYDIILWDDEAEMQGKVVGVLKNNQLISIK